MKKHRAFGRGTLRDPPPCPIGVGGLLIPSDRHFYAYLYTLSEHVNSISLDFITILHTSRLFLASCYKCLRWPRLARSSPSGSL